jgi:hypothetical protein
VRGALAAVLLLPAAVLPVLAAAAAPGETADPEDALVREVTRGPVSATLRLAPAAPRIGDVLELVLEVRAEPGVELLMPEFGEALDRFAIVDFAPDESIAADGATLARQRYRLQPSRSGPQSVPPLLVEFVDRRPGHPPSPEGEDAFELLTERLDFEVASVLADDAPLELRPARGTLSPLSAPRGPWWPFAVAAGVVALAALPLALRFLRAWSARRLQRSASDIARAELDALLYGPRPSGPQEMDAFYVRLSGIVRRYLENRFALRSPELTTEEFLEEMKTSPELTREHQQLLRDFLGRADLVKFAGFVPGAEDVEQSIESARTFLEETRENAEPAPAALAGAVPAGS